MTRIGFLHFTDVHFGMRSLTELWPAVRAALFQDLTRISSEAGPWDLVIFTGDFVGRGDREKEFELARDFLRDLRKKLDELGSDPKLVAVPGNHDLARPATGDPAAAVLQHLWGRELWDSSGVADVLFDEAGAASPYRNVMVAAFENYLRWWRDPGMDVLQPTTEGLIPGDFSATYEKGDVRLGLLGLNTTFLQLNDKSEAGDLALDPRQIQAACAGDVPDWASGHQVCLLLTHHPPSWLRPNAEATLMENVLQLADSSFAMHLCGHLHEPNAQFKQLGGAIPTRLLQGASLFGREHYGPDDRDRIHGYSACQLDVEQGEIRVWPRMAIRSGGLRLDKNQGLATLTDWFSWRISEGVTSRSTGQSALPKRLEEVLARRVTIYKRNLRYKFEVLEVTDHAMEVDLELSYELVNAANEPQSYIVGLLLEREVEYLAARYGSSPQIDLQPSSYLQGNHLEFAVQLPVDAPVPVCVRARVTYGVPDSEGLATYIPSLDYELELVRPAELHLVAQWLTAQQGECVTLPGNREIYKATEPLGQNQGMRLSWRLSGEAASTVGQQQRKAALDG